MGKNRFLLVFGLGFVFVLIMCVCTLYASWAKYNPDKNPIFTGFIIVLCTLSLSCFLLGIRWREDGLPQRIKPKPVVRTWTHNGYTMLCAEKDYQLWWQMKERFELADGHPMNYSHESSFLQGKPAPKFTAFFTDAGPNQQDAKGGWLSGFWAGSISDYKKIIEGCRVEKSELLSPYGLTPQALLNAGFRFVKFDGMYRLIHGHNALLLEELKSCHNRKSNILPLG